MENKLIILLLFATIIHLCYTRNYCNCNNNCCQQQWCCISCPICCSTHCNVTTQKPDPNSTPTTNPITTPTSSKERNNSNITILSNSTANNDVNITNTIINTNEIRVPINISLVNVNNISIPKSSGTVITSPPIPCPPEKDCSTTTEPRTSPSPQVVTKIVPKIIPFPIPVPVPVHVPVPVYIKVAWPVVIRQPYPVPSGCCMVVNPCIGLHCGHMPTTSCNYCQSNVMFRPMNPCQFGCHRRPYYIDYNCMHGGCHQSYFDCNVCGNDFYNSWSTYQSCIGCFSM